MPAAAAPALALVPPARIQPAPPQGHPPIQGWVVYHRRDGIFKTQVETGRTEKLADAGEWARWSPDGTRIAFLRGREVMVMLADGSEPRVLALSGEPHGVAFHPDGQAVLVADGERILSVSLADRGVKTILSGFKFREPDLAPGGRFVSSIRGLKVRIRAFDLTTGRNWSISGGCSASLSPDGRQVTQNAGDHRRLLLHNWDDARVLGTVSAPPGLLFDNQFWSNDPDWIASKSQIAYSDIFIHHVPSDRCWRITACGHCDRPDLFVLKPPFQP